MSEAMMIETLGHAWMACVHAPPMAALHPGMNDGSRSKIAVERT
jgi:hypothetical protein